MVVTVPNMTRGEETSLPGGWTLETSRGITQDSDERGRRRHEAMVRSDGTRVEYLGSLREGQRKLRYVRDNVSIRVVATRYSDDVSNLKLLDTWQVFFGSVALRMRDQWEAIPIQPKIIAEIVAAITQVLPNWPLGEDERLDPAHKLKFTTVGFDDRGKSFIVAIDEVVSHPDKYATFYSPKLQNLYFLKR